MIDVLLVLDDETRSRLGSVIRHLLVGMIDEAVKVKVLLRSNRQHTIDAIGPSRVFTIREGRWWRSQVSAETVLGLIGGEKPQFVHCLSANLGRWAQSWAMQWGAVQVVQCADLQDVREFAGLSASAYLVGTAINTRIEQALLKKCPHMQGRIRVIPPGLPAESEPACLNHPERIPSAIVTTPLTRGCRLDVILKALQQIVKEGREVHLFLLSEGSAESYYRRQVDQLQLRPYVTFAGQMPDWATLGRAMSAADFEIIPSPYARFTIATLIAMSRGLAVLAPAGMTEDYLIDGQTAVLFKPSRPDELAAKWAAMLANRDAARSIASGAIDYVRTHYKASSMVDATATMYRQLVESTVATS